MLLGMNMLLWTTHATREHNHIYQRLRDGGFDGVEIPLSQAGPSHFDDLGRCLNEVGLQRTAVYAPPPEACPVQMESGIRSAAADRFTWAIDCAASLGAAMLCGPFHTSYKYFTGQPPTESQLESSAEILHGAAEYAQTRGIHLAVEPLNRFECFLMNTVGQARAMVDKVGHPALGILYDTHHAHIEEKNIPDAIAIGGERIIHVHASENDRGAPGTGQVDWQANFHALKETGYDDWLTIEAFSPTSDEEFAAAIHLWRECIHEDEIFDHVAAFIRRTWDAA